MTRSESLQTGTAEFPRLLMPSANAHFVFSIGVGFHASYPASHPNAIEYMQWDAAEKNFRFHEIILDAIPPIGVVEARSRGVKADDEKCSKCHSTRNVVNTTTSPGTDGVSPGLIQVKNKPNWDTYDSWAGMLPFNRDRIYQGSVEAAAFRKIFNLWTWKNNNPWFQVIRSIVEQLVLQPPGVSSDDAITREQGGANDGHINFGFDASPPVLTEPTPMGPNNISSAYEFNGEEGTGVANAIVRDGDFVTLHHSDSPGSDEGRGVQLFDLIGGADGSLNQQRVADEIINHRFMTGGHPVDVRPVAMAIAQGCFNINSTTDTVTSATAALTIDSDFFNDRHNMNITQLIDDTELRARSLTRRKADIQKLNFDRTGDVYLSTVAGGDANGLIQEYGSTTTSGTDTSLNRLRAEVFRRGPPPGFPDSTAMEGAYVDRELSSNFQKVALYRYFLEPLGVSVDKWSTGVRGRSRTYSFADIFGSYTNVFVGEFRNSLTTDPFPGLTNPDDCAQLTAAVNTSLGALPAADEVSTFTDVQRIFNKNCIECHGGLAYPPYSRNGSVGFVNLSEDTSLSMGGRLDRSHIVASSLTSADPNTSYLYDLITRTSEDCLTGMMPCGGPALSQVDVETIRRWIVGGSALSTGDPHMTTVDGVRYDFQSAGEHIMLRSPGFELQTRHTAIETASPLGPNRHTGLTSCVSVNSAMALRIGQHRITYQPNINGRPDSSGLQLRIDGKLQKINAKGIILQGGGRIIQTEAPGGLKIEAPGGTVVTVTPRWWEREQVWFMNLDTKHVRATQGIMGVVASGNWLPALPNGRLLGARPSALSQRYKQLYGEFGDAWRVTDDTSLFDYAAGVSTASFNVNGWPLENPQSCALPTQDDIEPRPLVKPLALAQAQALCKDVVDDELRENCIQDVRITAEPAFAATYLLTEKVSRNAIPDTPVLKAPEQYSAGLVLPITFNWGSTSDTDKDEVTYQHCVWPVGKKFTLNHCSQVILEESSTEQSLPNSILLLFILLFIVAILICLLKKNKPFIITAVFIVLLLLLLFYFFKHKGAENNNPELSGEPINYVVTDLDQGKRYYWKVIAEDGKGETVESKTQRFDIK